MPTLSTGAQNVACDAIVDSVDGGTTNAAGQYRLGTAAMASILGVIALNNPAFGNAGASVAGRADLDTTGGLSTTAIATGTAAAFELQDRDAANVVTGSVGTAGTDMIIDDVSIEVGQTINLNGMGVQVPASPA